MATSVNRLRIIKIFVRGSDPRWSGIDWGRYAHVDNNTWAADFPVDLTDREVTVAIFPRGHFGNHFWYQEVVSEIGKRKLRLPDRAVVETVLDELSNELADCPIVGICSSGEFVGYIVGGSGRYIYHRVARHGWPGNWRFVAVVEEPPP